MKLVAPKSFTYKGGDRAVLLLHGFTGNTVDVRRLGKYLNDRGFTCHGPVYKGHGIGPEALIETGPEDWWESALDGYDFLKSEGYAHIVVAGVSLGGIFSLKLGMELPVKAIVSMSATVKERDTEDLFLRVKNYAKGFWSIQGKSEEEIELGLAKLTETDMPSLDRLRQLILENGKQLEKISAPIFILQGLLDLPPYLESAKTIYDNVRSEHKELKYYEQSDHIITLGAERDQVHEDIYQFLDGLEW